MQIIKSRSGINTYSFDDRLRMSEGVVAATVSETIAAFLPGCIGVQYTTDMASQRAGVDYTATLRGGAHVLIDHKARDAGIAKYWANGPELALEVYSVKPGSHSRDRTLALTGWTLDEAKRTDYTLHTFAPEDSNLAYLLPFQLLRGVFRARCKDWKREYRVATQATTRGNETWQSECVFVPARLVMREVARAMVRAA